MRTDAEVWALVLEHQGLIHSYAKTRCRGVPDQEGIRGDLLLALHRACASWDRDRSRLSTWAYMHFNTALQRRWTASRRERSMTPGVELRARWTPHAALMARMDLERVYRLPVSGGRSGQALQSFLLDPEEGQQAHAARAGVSRQALSSALRRHLRRV